MIESESKTSISTINAKLDNTSFNVYQEDAGLKELTIYVTPSKDIALSSSLNPKVSQWAMLTIQSKTVETLTFKFLKDNGDPSNVAEQTIQPFSVTNNLSLLITLNENGEFKVIATSANEFSEKGIERIESLISAVAIEAAGIDVDGVNNIIKQSLKTGGDIRKAIDEAIAGLVIEGIEGIEVGNSNEIIPTNALKKQYTINLSGWLFHSLGTIDIDDKNEIVKDGRSINVIIDVELSENFKSEQLIYPYILGTQEENKAVAPVLWSLYQQKAGLGTMPLIPGENKFKDYTSLTIEALEASPPVQKPIVAINGTIQNTTEEYLIGGRFHGANTLSAVSTKDKVSVHSQGALLLHVVFSVTTPREVYFIINNPYAPFVKILFYSFQIQSFYNCVLKYFYSPLYKKVTFKQKSFDRKGLFINSAPVAGAAKKISIQNIYQFSKFENEPITNQLRFAENDSQVGLDDDSDIEEDDTLQRSIFTGIRTGIRDCDFRYYNDISIVPLSTMPLLKTANIDFFTTPNEQSIISIDKKPAFIKYDKKLNIIIPTINTSLSLTNPNENNAIFQVIDKATMNGSTLENPITPVVDMNFAMATTTTAPIKNVEKIALTVNSNTIFVIGEKFMKKFTEGKFKAFDLIFNQKQFWLKIVLTKGAVAEFKKLLDNKSIETLFPQFGLGTTSSQSAIINGLKNITNTTKAYEITFKIAIKSKTLTDKNKTVILDPIDKVLGIRPTIFTAGTITGTAGTAASREFEVKELDLDIKNKLKEIGIDDLE